MSTKPDINVDLADFIASFHDDPLGFVIAAYPWGEPGTLENYPDGPDKWQVKFLEDLGLQVRERAFDGHNPVLAIKKAVSSGHGVGKGVIAAWLTDWILSTRPMSKGTVTANTFAQLKTKTWATIMKWTKLCITSHWFTITEHMIYRTGYRDSWFCAPQSCKEENSEAFAGQHAADSTSFYIFDESSGIPPKIFEVAEGGLTDGEPMFFLLGNCTRRDGEFHKAVFGANRNEWRSSIVDGREARFTNKKQIEEWIKKHGLDSDFVRVRVRGLPPVTSQMQFIDSELVFQAQRAKAEVLLGDPLIAGVDCSRGGDDQTVIRFRRGMDARSIKPIRFEGAEVRDSMLLVSKLAEVLNDQRPGHRVTMMFLDSAIGGAIVNRLHQLGYKQRVQEINFGWSSPDAHCANMRAHMWNRCKEWLRSGGALDDSPDLEIDLTSPGFHFNSKDQLLIEAKEDLAERGIDSPDDGDALCLTFARPVAIVQGATTPKYTPASAWG